MRTEAASLPNYRQSFRCEIQAGSRLPSWLAADHNPPHCRARPRVYERYAGPLAGKEA
jgi:hypothetical protein